MKVVFVGSQYYNGDMRAGFSYEYTHLAGTLIEMGLDVTFVDNRQSNLDRRVCTLAAQSDVVIVTPIEHELEWEAFGQLQTPTVMLLCDDEWRREYGLSVAPYADYVMTTALDGKEAYGDKYIPFQWAARLSLYKQRSPTIPISFIGLKYGYREQLVQFINRLGLPVAAFGQGWSKNITDAQIVDVLCSSAISLTTSLSSRDNHRQIKARNFEIPASGALLMAEYAPGLENYYTDGKEACFWYEPKDLAEKLYFYRGNEGARRRVAMAGRQRTAREHDYRMRFRPMLERLGTAIK